MKIWVVVQSSWSDGELYAHSFYTEKGAEEFVESRIRDSYVYDIYETEVR